MAVRAATAVSVGAVTLVLVAQLLLQLSGRAGWAGHAWLVLAVGLLVGLPHGAVDHLVPGWAGARTDGLRLPALLAGYVAVAAVALVVLRAAPAPALAVFLLLSAAHFGAGEVQFAALRAGRPPTRQTLTAGTWGAVTAVLPLVRWPHQVAPVLAALVPGTSGLLPAAGCVTATALIGVAVLLTTLRLGLAGRWRDAAELVVITALFALVPPLVAFGVYFGGWHAVRHLARLLLLDPTNRRELRMDLRGPLSRFGRSAALPTAAALLGLGVLWSAAHGWQQMLAADLVVLAALTAPHLTVVAWLDTRLRQEQGPR